MLMRARSRGPCPPRRVNDNTAFVLFGLICVLHQLEAQLVDIKVDRFAAIPDDKCHMGDALF